MNMPQVIKKFVRALNVFSSSVSKHIYVNALFGQKKSSNGQQEWNNACTKVGLRLRKLNILMKIKSNLFQTLCFYLCLCKFFLWEFIDCHVDL